MSEPISVEVVYATREKQELVSVTLEPGASVGDALDASGLREKFRDEDFSALQAGIWGHLAEHSDLVKDGDRVEFYRPLARDPRDARRELAKAQRLGSSS